MTDFSVSGGPRDVKESINDAGSNVSIGSGSAVAVDGTNTVRSLFGGTGITITETDDLLTIDATGTTKTLTATNGITLTSTAPNDNISLTDQSGNGVAVTSGVISLEETITGGAGITNTAGTLNLDISVVDIAPQITFTSGLNLGGAIVSAEYTKLATVVGGIYHFMIEFSDTAPIGNFSFPVVGTGASLHGFIVMNNTTNSTFMTGAAEFNPVITANRVEVDWNYSNPTGQNIQLRGSFTITA